MPMSTPIHAPPRSVALSLAVGLTLALSASAHADDGLTSPALRTALEASLTVTGGRVELVALDRPAGDCLTSGVGTRAEISRPIDGSGRLALKLIGSRARGGACEVWAWARVRVFAEVPIAARAIRGGEPLAAVVRREEREIKPGHVPAVLTEGATASRAVGAGQMIEANVVSGAGPRPGQSIKVLIVSGALAVEQEGRAVPCGREGTCAVLPSGKHVEGSFADGRLTVLLP